MSDIISRLTHFAALKRWGGATPGIRLLLAEAAKELAEAYEARDEAFALACKLNGGEELQSLMKQNNEMAAELNEIYRRLGAQEGECALDILRAHPDFQGTTHVLGRDT